MAVWETEDEYSGAAAASLPTPTDTPYRTPSRSSRRSRRSVTPPGKSSSPPPVPGTDKTDTKISKRSSKDMATDETISILDPRRFTPTLHANLVSEILSLRRDQEEKTKIIESLESSLHATREEEESLQTTLLSTAKENRSLKRQLALLEGGTSSALGELARERDEAVDTATETKKRLEQAQKKLRSQEDDSQRVHDLLAREKDEWEEEKRKYERKIHVAESRLKVVLDEVAAYQAAHVNGQNGVESEVEEPAKDNDAASVRTMSMTNSIRFSVINNKPNGHSLADELNFDDDDYHTDHDGRESVMSNHVHMRNASRDSIMSKTHRRHQSNESLIRPGSVARGRFQTQLERLADGIIQEDDEIEPAPKVSYTDTGIQYSPPPSPKVQPSKPTTPEPPILTARLERLHEVESPPREWEVEANQRRKRVGIVRPLTIQAIHKENLMVSTSAQTVDEPLSPPKTPKSPFEEVPPSPQMKPAPAMVSSASQTDPPVLQQHFVMPPLPQMPIPSISIHPPTSRPTTPREPRLPQLFKDFGCQVSILASVPSTSIGIQTEEIRIDKRLDKLPAHLHPSAITSRPTSPRPVSPAPEAQPSGDVDHHFTPVPGNLPPRNPRRLTNKKSLTDITSSPPPVVPAPVTHDAYPGNNDDGPLSHSNQKAPARRPHRISSLFAGFDGGSSDEVDDFADADLSDSEYRTALSAPRPQAKSSRPGKRSSGGTSTTSPEQVMAPRSSNRNSMRPLGGADIYNSYPLPEGREAPARKPSVKGMSRSSVNSNRGSVMRRAAMIQNGIATHQGRARSPSLPDPRDPPFPIPTRASSRKPPTSVSAPSDGQRSPTRPNEPWHKRGMRNSHNRANSIRKVRSAAAIPVKPRYNRRQGSRSPPPFSPSEEPESPGLPPLPNNDITTPRINGGKFRSHHQQPSTNTANTDATGFMSQSSSQAATGVVDAIAQTMVGEWMFKYVRRRKSFGMPEGSGKDDSSNDRHKRWVWLAPYERAILWSSKQPSSGSALLGKSGRKLTIQSVLDVKDDNPTPKGVPQLFNRSILILTPQRALKFTAVNAERHYLWLTSLSFLAHSQQAVPEIVPVVAPKAVPEFELPKTKLRKPGIRDSIRLAKGKNGVVPPRPGAISAASSNTGEFLPSIPSIPSVPPSIASFKPPESFISLPSHQRELSGQAAEAPFIPRFHERANQALVHGRKRSNTGGHVPPPLSFRGFSGPVGNGGAYHAATNSTAGNSTGTAGSSDIYQSQAGSSNAWAMSSAASQRTSEASSRPSGAVMNNFFDAIGTVRMEAFISPLAFSRFDEYPDEQEEVRYRARRRSKEARRRKSRSRHRDSYNSRGTRGTDDYYGGSRTGGEEDFYFRDDPFKGF